MTYEYHYVARLANKCCKRNMKDSSKNIQILDLVLHLFDSYLDTYGRAPK